tara:strand:- start:227 stop:451 length:225 start_codon:yes stop_codon:yes gene_type:complete
MRYPMNIKFTIAIVILFIGFVYLVKPQPTDILDTIVEDAKILEQKEQVLTNNEKDLKVKSENKEWEEVDKQTDK